MEHFAQLSQTVIAVLLSTFLVWFCLEYLKGLRKNNEELDKVKDEQGRQGTTIEQIKFENRKAASEIHSLGETIKELRGELRREMEDRNLRLREVEQETRQNRRAREYIHRRIDVQDKKLRKHNNLITTLYKDVEDDDSNESS